MDTDPQPSDGPARCAQHPDVGSVGTCARCGSFMCSDCRAPELPSHCAPCLTRLNDDRWVRQVPILGIAMMVHGVLLVGAALNFVGLSGMFAADLAATPAPPEEGPFAELFSGVVFGAFGFMAVVHVIPGALQIWAGWRARTYRSRALAFVALIAGLISLLGCYCAPTALGMLVWGLVVLAGDAVRDRFAASAASDT